MAVQRKMSKKSSKAQKAPRVNKTSEEVAKEIKQREEVVRQRAIVTDRLYPILMRASKNIADASQFLQIVKISLQQAFNNEMWGKTIADLKLSEKLDPKADRADYFKEFLDQLINEKVGTAIGLTEGLSDEIQRLLRKEQSERKLDTLKTDFIKTDDVQTTKTTNK